MAITVDHARNVIVFIVVEVDVVLLDVDDRLAQERVGLSDYSGRDLVVSYSGKRRIYLLTSFWQFARAIASDSRIILSS